MAKSPREVTTEILAGIDVLAEFRALGVDVVGEPRQSGMASCRAFGREDKKPSGFINIKTGIFGDSGGKDVAACTMSLFDLAVKVGKFADWRQARKFYAQRAGVKLGRYTKEEANDPRYKLELQSWDTPGNDTLATRWTILAKKGTSLEAIKAMGGTMAYYPCYRDKDGNRKRGTHCRQVIAVPAYGEYLLDTDPVAWVCYGIDGKPFDLSPKGHPASEPRVTAKQVSVGPTRGTFLNLSALMALTDPEARAKVKLVWWTEGPPDALALITAMPPELRGEQVVLTVGGGATSDILDHQVKLLAGLNVAIVGDADEAGVVGAWKRAMAIHSVCESVRVIDLGYEKRPSHGLDLRDWILGVL